MARLLACLIFLPGILWIQSGGLAHTHPEQTETDHRPHFHTHSHTHGDHHHHHHEDLPQEEVPTPIVESGTPDQNPTPDDGGSKKHSDFQWSLESPWDHDFDAIPIEPVQAYPLKLVIPEGESDKSVPFPPEGDRGGINDKPNYHFFSWLKRSHEVEWGERPLFALFSVFLI
jgi:hypothetical protein